MAGTAALSYPNAVEHNGIVYLIGVRDGEYRLRRTCDGGETWLPFSDSEIERPVADATNPQRAALVKLSGQGSPLLACVPQWPQLLIYSSFDDGDTWQLESQI